MPRVLFRNIIMASGIKLLVIPRGEILLVFSRFLIQIQLNLASIAFHCPSKNSIAAFGAYIAGFFVSNPLVIAELSSIRDSPENNLLSDGHGEIVNIVTGKFIAFMTAGIPFLLCTIPDLTLATMHKPFIG